MTIAKHPWANRILYAAFALHLLASSTQAHLDEPFGLPTVAVPGDRLSGTWRDLQSEMQLELSIIAQCRVEFDSCSSAAALRFLTIVDEGMSYVGLSRIGRINRAVNLAIRPTGIGAGRNDPGKWTSPLATLAAGIGDCKQYVILKYAALRDAGYAPDDLQIVIVRIRSTREYHAVVAVRNAGRWFILDNRSLAVVESREHYEFLPVLALDHRGVRQFVLPSSPAVAGSPGPRVPA